jgi:hypothetical protein
MQSAAAFSAGAVPFGVLRKRPAEPPLKLVVLEL